MSATELHPTTAGIDTSVLDALSDRGATASAAASLASASPAAPQTPFSIHTAAGAALDTTSASDIVDFFKEHPGVFWLDCEAPRDDDVVALCDALFGGLHPLTVELMVGANARDTFQELRSYVFFTFGDAHAVVMSDKGIMSVTRGPSVFRGSVQRRLNRSVPFRTEWICYALVDRLTRAVLPAMRRMDSDCTWVNDHVYVRFDADQKAVLDQLATTRHNVMTALTRLRGKLEVVEALARRWSSENVGHYFHDVGDSLLAMKNRLEAHETLLGNTHRNWMAVTQMNLEKTKSKVLVVVGMFLSLATVFVPMLTVYTSGHMNLEGPGMDSSKTHSLAWWGTINGVVVGLATIVVFCSYRYFRYIMKRPPPSLTGEYR